MMHSRTARRAMPARVMGLAVFVLLAIPPISETLLAATAANRPPAEPPRAASAFDHFLYLTRDTTDTDAISLVLAQVTPEGFQRRNVITVDNLAHLWDPLDVVGGRLYARHRGFLLEIDLATGKALLLARTMRSYTYDSGRVYAIIALGADAVLRVFDLKTRSTHDLCILAGASQGPLLAISPSRKTLACFPNGRVLTLVDLASGTSKTVGPNLLGSVMMARGMDAPFGPQFRWLDEKTILFFHDVREMPAPGYPVTNFLATLEIDSGEIADVVKLPTLRAIASRSSGVNESAQGEAHLRPWRADGVPRVLLGGLGQYRIDVEGKRLVEDDTLVAPYALTWGSSPVRLLCGPTELDRSERFLDVAVSPDARRVVWSTATDGAGAELYYFDRAAGSSRLVAEGWFPASAADQPLPDESLILWAAGEQVAPAPPSEPLAGWEPFPTDPWPRPPAPPRPPGPTIADFFSLVLSTDKAIYQQHEPARVTFTLTNTTDQQVEFNRFTGSSTPFRVTRTSPRTSAIVDVTTDMLPIPEEDSSASGSSENGGRLDLFLDARPLTLRPRESIQLIRYLELSDPGQTTIVGSVSLDCQEIAPYTNRWHGPVASAPMTLTVVPAADERPLLEAKVERLFELCRREYNRNSNWGDYTRLYQLGPEGVPLIVDTLKACDEVKFRRRMGQGLAAMATADALPYFEQLVAGDLKDDWEMVLDGLATMVEKSRSAEEALGLLLEAMNHPDLGIRGQAADRLRRVYDPRVAAAMREQLHREGSAAKTAAMYLAAAEWLDLAEWLALAAEKPTEERVRAIGPVIEKIQARWKLALPVPKNPWGDDLLNDPDRLAEYRSALEVWEQWARENPRTSAKFFDDERSGWPERPPEAERDRGGQTTDDP